MGFSNRIIIFGIVSATVFVGCSNSKNTASTRAFHNLTSHYNVYFNATQYYLDGVEKIDNAMRLHRNFAGV